MLSPARAAEGATGFYLLGSKTSMAGYIPPHGTYVSDANYNVSGSADVELNVAGLELTVTAAPAHASARSKGALRPWARS